jgi:dTDP-glucose pyrophosphorylase
MAGRGSRFANAGYRDPKPLIPLGGKPMIQWVIENIRPSRPHRFVFICLQEHLVRYPTIARTLELLAPGSKIVPVEKVTEGAACTVLLARELIDSNAPLMIANSDQYVDLPIDRYLTTLDDSGADGMVMTFTSSDPKWSYCRLTAKGFISEIREKEVISNEATVGIYNFTRGADFVRSANEMVAQQQRVNGEYYVAPVYNTLIESGKRIITHRLAGEDIDMFGLGTPEDVRRFMTTRQYHSGKSHTESRS